MLDKAAYLRFLESKADYGARHGFDPISMPSFLFDFQVSLTDWAIRNGRSAIFADCGMGKTPMQLVWADNVVKKTNKPVLIITPLGVTQQTLNEAAKFQIEACRAGGQMVAIHVTNYEKLHKLDPTKYAGCVCDESSILKNFDGTRKAEVTEFMRRVPYRLLCTATAAPNDWPELGTSSEALGYMGYVDMLTRFFTDKFGVTKVQLYHGRFSGQEWRLKGHAEQPFWQWIASWARAARKPSDLGFDDDGFILPPLVENHTRVKASMPRQGMLFEVEAVNWQEEREVNRRSIPERCEAAAEKVAQHKISLVWCHLNEEAALLKKLIPFSVEVSGQDPEDKKEKAVDWFCNSSDERRVLISKPRIFGFGLNFQHCDHMTYFPTHSYEQYYQAVRRCWRFGQKNEVVIDHIDTDGGDRVWKNLVRKSKAADQMFVNMVAHMNEAISPSSYNPNGKVTIPQWLQKKS